jgi:hypothetical protein
MKRLLIPILGVLALAGFAFWWFSPGQVIKRRTQSLLETLTLDPGSGRASRQMGVYPLNALLAAEVELNTPTIDQANGTFERSEIESGFTWLCQQAKQTRFDLRRIHSLEVNGDRGVVDFSLDALVELPTYRPADGAYRVTYEWRREDDAWRLFKATWIEENP